MIELSQAFGILITMWIAQAGAFIWWASRINEIVKHHKERIEKFEDWQMRHIEKNPTDV